jgi:7,8-dihydroneopterin aldolase/epimerase/oxygenase
MSRAVLDGMVPLSLQPRFARILLDRLEVQADIGFHAYEVGKPQRVLVTVEIWLDHVPPADRDEPETAWNYDVVRQLVERLAGERRYNLQETLAYAIYEGVASLHGVRALRVLTAKPDTYPNAEAIAFEISSLHAGDANS